MARRLSIQTTKYTTLCLNLNQTGIRRAKYSGEQLHGRTVRANRFGRRPYHRARPAQRLATDPDDSERRCRLILASRRCSCLRSTVEFLLTNWRYLSRLWVNNFESGETTLPGRLLSSCFRASIAKSSTGETKRIIYVSSHSANE